MKNKVNEEQSNHGTHQLRSKIAVGFTLIELLAVIVVVGLLAAITVPIIMNTMKESRKSTFLTSVQNMVTLIEQYNGDNNFKLYGQYDIEKDKITYKGAGNIEDRELTYKGVANSSGAVKVDKKGMMKLKVGTHEFCATGTNKRIIIIDDDCSKLDETPPNLTLSSKSVMTNAMTIEASAEDLESGIEKYYFSTDGITYKEQEKTEYKRTNLKPYTAYKTYVKVENRVGLTTTENITVTTKELTAPTYKVAPTGDTWAASKTVTITYPKVAGQTLQYEYSLNGGTTWTSVATSEKQLVFTATGNVIARVTDGENYVTASVLNITRIDTTAPTGVVATIGVRTTKKVEVRASATDSESGIVKYEYNMDSSSTWINAGTGTSFTFNNVTTGNHTFQVRATNGASLVTNSTVITSSPNEITIPTYSVNPTGDTWAQQKTVTIFYPVRETDFVYQYSINGGTSWVTVASPATTQSINFTAVGNVIARVYDGVNYKTASVLNITKIDRTAPTVPTATIRYDNASGAVRPNTTAFTNRNLWWGSYTATDTGGSGIDHYEYSGNCSGTSHGTLSTAGYTYSGTTDYSYCIRAVDNVGNISAWSSPYYFKMDQTLPTYGYGVSSTNFRVIDTGYAYLSVADAGGSGISLGNSRYYIDTNPSVIGVNHGAWNSQSAFTSTSITVPVGMETQGIYYVHILATDNSGNKNEYVSPGITIREFDVSDVDGTGYNITTYVRNSGAYYVEAFPTWTLAYGQDDLRWATPDANGGNIYYYRARRSNHKFESGPYITHIYIRKRSDNSIWRVLQVEVTIPPGEIVEVLPIPGSAKIWAITNNVGKYGMDCAVWTMSNGQDDIIWYNSLPQAATGVYFLNINRFNHGRESDFVTHCYYKDGAGNRQWFGQAVWTQS